MEKEMSDLSEWKIEFPEDAAAPLAAFRKPNSMFMDGCVDPPNGRSSWC
jgi:hypothetical protein